jgi:hypothetical protein
MTLLSRGAGEPEPEPPPEQEATRIGRRRKGTGAREIRIEGLRVAEKEHLQDHFRYVSAPGKCPLSCRTALLATDESGGGIA